MDFIEKSKLNAKYFFAIMTYGNIAASGLKHIEEVGSKAGIQFNYTNEILMIDNYLPLFDIEEQFRKERSKRIEEKLDQVVSDIRNGQAKLTRKGFVSDILSRPIKKLTAKFHYDEGDKWFIVQDNCNGCKVCEKVCPRDNVKVVRKAEFLHKCEGCFACIHHCPQNAIYLKLQRSKTRFMNRNLTLKEIIDANNQSNS
jgi:NAD-dependent dihydropyrimidine dehydrogenase PreA subunit